MFAVESRRSNRSIISSRLESVRLGAVGGRLPGVMGTVRALHELRMSEIVTYSRR